MDVVAPPNLLQVLYHDWFMLLFYLSVIFCSLMIGVSALLVLYRLLALLGVHIKLADKHVAQARLGVEVSP